MKCIEEGCEKNAYYNYANESRKYCREHRKDGMISLVRKLCNVEGCIFYAMYGIEKAEYCKDHKKDTMLNKSVKRCEEVNCGKQASYGKPGEVRKYCKEHSKDGMEDVVSMKCSHEGCNKVKPPFGKKDSPERYCSEHKKDGMIQFIKGNQCIKCNKVPIYNLKGLPARYCGDHREKEMINVSTKRCEHDDCDTIASFDLEGGSGRYCVIHKKEGMMNIKIIKKEKECINCSLKMPVNKRGYCKYCNPSARRGPILMKQTALFEYLDARDLVGSSTDSLIKKGKYGKERPDRIYELNHTIIIVECDENQHKDRERECEIIRMKNIAQCFDGKAVCFIRWNPDSYKSLDKSIETVGMRHKRAGDLIEDIKNCKVKLPTCLACVVYMYYDGWKGYNDIQWEILQSYENKFI